MRKQRNNKMNFKMPAMMKRIALIVLLVLGFQACDAGFESLNENPNQPTEISSSAVLPGAIRSSVNASVNMSYLVGNNIAQLTAKTLRKEVDLYLWNSFNNFVWDPMYNSLRDIEGLYNLGVEENNPAVQGVALVLRSWVFSVLTDAYGDIPYTEAISADNGIIFPVYNNQQDIYLGENGLLATLDEAAQLLSSGGNLDGDILYNGDTDKWRRLANALQLRLWMRVAEKVPSDAASNIQRLSNASLMRDHTDGGLLTYLGVAPNQFPTQPLKIGDFDAVNASDRMVDSLTNWSDPRLEIYARPVNASALPEAEPFYAGLVNGADQGGGSRLGYIYYDYPNHPVVPEEAQGIIMTHAEQEFILAEAAQRGFISASAENYYNSGVLSSMLQYGADSFLPYTAINGTQINTVSDYLAQPQVALSSADDPLERIAAQKWIALFFTGLEPWFDWRRTGRPAMEPSLNNENNDQVPLRFLYPGSEQLLNLEQYQVAVSRLDNGDDINSSMWLVE